MKVLRFIFCAVVVLSLTAAQAESDQAIIGHYKFEKVANDIYFGGFDSSWKKRHLNVGNTETGTGQGGILCSNIPGRENAILIGAMQLDERYDACLEPSSGFGFPTDQNLHTPSIELFDANEMLNGLSATLYVNLIMEANSGTDYNDLDLIDQKRMILDLDNAVDNRTLTGPGFHLYATGCVEGQQEAADITLDIQFVNSNDIQSISVPVACDAWHKVGVSLRYSSDSTAMKVLFQVGDKKIVRRFSGTFTPTNTANTTSLYVGNTTDFYLDNARPTATGIQHNVLNGYISDFRLFNKALTGAEMDCVWADKAACTRQINVNGELLDGIQGLNVDTATATSRSQNNQQLYDIDVEDENSLTHFLSSATKGVKGDTSTGDSLSTVTIESGKLKIVNSDGSQFTSSETVVGADRVVEAADGYSITGATINSDGDLIVTQTRKAACTLREANESCNETETITVNIGRVKGSPASLGEGACVDSDRIVGVSGNRIGAIYVDGYAIKMEVYLGNADTPETITIGSSLRGATGQDAAPWPALSCDASELENYQGDSGSNVSFSLENTGNSGTTDQLVATVRDQNNNTTTVKTSIPVAKGDTGSDYNINNFQQISGAANTDYSYSYGSSPVNWTEHFSIPIPDQFVGNGSCELLTGLGIFQFGYCGAESVSIYGGSTQYTVSVSGEYTPNSWFSCSSSDRDTLFYTMICYEGGE